MAIRKNTPMGFVDMALEDFGSPRTAKLLDKLDAATPWDTLARPITQLPEYKDHGAGRPQWEPVMMLKCLMLANKWFNLSDPGLEEGLKDRISFRKFIGLSFIVATPAAKVHDSKCIDKLAEDEEVAVLADNAYSLEDRRKKLRKRKVIDRIVYKRVRGQAGRLKSTSPKNLNHSFSGLAYHEE